MWTILLLLLSVGQSSISIENYGFVTIQTGYLFDYNSPHIRLENNDNSLKDVYVR